MLCRYVQEAEALESLEHKSSDLAAEYGRLCTPPPLHATLSEADLARLQRWNISTPMSVLQSIHGHCWHPTASFEYQCEVQVQLNMMPSNDFEGLQMRRCGHLRLGRSCTEKANVGSHAGYLISHALSSHGPRRQGEQPMTTSRSRK